MKIDQKVQPVSMILCDVDGVLTDGGITYDNQGIETKQFHVRDGLGIQLWQKAGYKFGLLTARSSHIVQVRAGELGVDIIRQGFSDKLPVAQQIVTEFGLEAENVCYVGDDLTDFELMKYVGFGVAVADAVDEIKDVADHVTRLSGGQGAVRELIETMLKSQQRWDEVVKKYTGT